MTVVILVIISLYGGTLISPTWIIFMSFIFAEAKFNTNKKPVNKLIVNSTFADQIRKVSPDIIG